MWFQQLAEEYSEEDEDDEYDDEYKFEEQEEAAERGSDDVHTVYGGHSTGDSDVGAFADPADLQARNGSRRVHGTVVALPALQQQQRQRRQRQSVVRMRGIEAALDPDADEATADLSVAEELAQLRAENARLRSQMQVQGDE